MVKEKPQFARYTLLYPTAALDMVAKYCELNWFYILTCSSPASELGTP